jgi:DNA-binding NarL/FixJ family response regulator
MADKLNRPRLALADDHRVILDGLVSLLEPEFEVVATAQDGQALLEAVGRLRPDLALVDISMPGLDGLDCTRRLTEDHPETKVIILTMQNEAAFEHAAAQAGASGFVHKNSPAKEIRMAIRAVLGGSTYFSHKDGAPAPDSPLTPRQLEVLRLLSAGHSHKQIAAILGISIKTAEFHKYAMQQTLGLKTTAELVQYAIRNGLIVS